MQLFPSSDGESLSYFQKMTISTASYTLFPVHFYLTLFIKKKKFFKTSTLEFFADVSVLSFLSRFNTNV